MTDARTPNTPQDQTSARPPVYAHTLSSEAVLDALKMILIGAPLNDVLTSIALLIGKKGTESNSLREIVESKTGASA